MANKQRQRKAHWGRIAKRISAAWLMPKGYRLIGQRLKTPVEEIDLLMRHGDALVFVGVKARAALDSGVASLHPAAARRC